MDDMEVKFPFICNQKLTEFIADAEKSYQNHVSVAPETTRKS